MDTRGSRRERGRGRRTAPDAALPFDHPDVDPPQPPPVAPMTGSTGAATVPQPPNVVPDWQADVLIGLQQTMALLASVVVQRHSASTSRAPAA